MLFILCAIYSRTLARVATVICWLYPTLNKFYLILSYLILYIFIQQNVFENVFRKRATILFLTQCVKFLQLIQRLGTCKFHQLHAQYSIELQRLDNLTWWYQDSSPSLIYMVFPWKIYVVAAGLYKQFCLRKGTWKIKCKSLQNVSHFSHSQAQQPLPVTDNWELS